MPFPLPDDVQNVDGLQYFLVAVPNDSAYSRAALGAVSQFENAWIWGLEGEVPIDSELAAQHWAAANAETVRLIQMGWPELVIQHIDEIEDMLGALSRLGGCCYDEDVSDGDLYTDPVQEGVGDVPQNIIDAGFATGVTDWEGFATYKCMIAHITVDDLQGKLTKLAPLVDNAGLVVGGLGALAAILGVFLTGGSVVILAGMVAGFGAVAALWKALLSGTALTDLAAKVATYHQDLVCAFMEGDGAAGSWTALKAEIDNLFNPAEALILKSLNSLPGIKALYSGRYDQQDIAQQLDDAGYVPSSYDCNCNPDAEFMFTWNDGAQGWFVGGTPFMGPEGGHYYTGFGTSSGVWRATNSQIDKGDISTLLNLPPIGLVSSGFARIRIRTGAAPNGSVLVRFKFIEDGNVTHISPAWGVYYEPPAGNFLIDPNVWVDVSWQIDEGRAIDLEGGDKAVEIEFFYISPLGSGWHIDIDTFGASP